MVYFYFGVDNFFNHLVMAINTRPVYAVDLSQYFTEDYGITGLKFWTDTVGVSQFPACAGKHFESECPRSCWARRVDSASLATFARISCSVNLSLIFVSFKSRFMNRCHIEFQPLFDIGFLIDAAAWPEDFREQPDV